MPGPTSRYTVIFDFGGVLLHWQPLDLLQQIVPQQAPDAARAKQLADLLFQSFVPGGDWSEFDRGGLSIDALTPRLARRSGLSEAEVKAVIDAIPGHLQAQADTVALLGRLHAAGHRLCFLSNMPAPYADYLDRTQAFIRQFEQGIYSSRIGLVKPQAEIFRHAQQVFAVPPDQCLFIDDHPANVQQARDCGWHALQFTGAAQCAEQLRGGWQLAF